MRIVFLFPSGRAERLKRTLAGELPADFFMGAISLMRAGHHVRIMEAGQGTRVNSLAGAVVRELKGSLLPLEFDLGIVRALRARLDEFKAADAIFCAGPNLLFNAALALGARNSSRVLFGYADGLGRRASGDTSVVGGIPLLVLRRIASRPVRLALYGEGEMGDIVRRLHLPEKRVVPVPFGVDQAFWSPSGISGLKEKFVLSVGNDVFRDYATLLEAARLCPDTRFLIVTKRNLEAAPANVEVRRGAWNRSAITDAELRELYRSAACVVLPISRNAYSPSGQSVALQAMACGCPVVISNNPGLWDRSRLIDGETVLLPPAADPAALAHEINRLLGDAALQRKLAGHGLSLISAHWNEEALARRLERLFKESR